MKTVAGESSTNSPSVLIVTHRRALEVDGVIDELRKRRARVSRLNMCQFPEHETLSISDGAEVVRLSRKFDSGWLHDVGFFTTARSLVGIRRDISLRECSSFLNGYLFSVDCKWLNDPRAINFASNKIVQIDTASSLRVPIPHSLITNDPSEAREFVKANGRTIVKTLGTGYLDYGRQQLKFYTRRFSALSDDFLKGLRFGPVIFQAEVVKKREVRVTVVEDKAFSTQLDCVALPTEFADIRQLDYVQYRQHFSRASGVDRLETWSKAIMSRLGLSYAALDWAIDESGKAYFLECNPLGSFKWSEVCGDFKISEAIASALMRRARSRTRNSR